MGRRPLGKTATQARNVDAMSHKTKEQNLGLDTRILAMTLGDTCANPDYHRMTLDGMIYSIGSTVVTVSIFAGSVIP